MTRWGILVFALALPLAADDVTLAAAPPPAPAAPPVYIPLTAQQRWDDYVRRSFSPKAIGARAGRNGVTNLWSNTPPEWADGGGGYGKRLASDFGRTWIRRGIESAGAAAIGQDPRYIPCRCDGKWKRVAHAMSQSVLAYDNDGKRAFGYARVGSRYAASMIETTWFPDRYGWKDGFREGSQSVLTVGIFNIAREFWPDIKGKIKRKKK
jgi:hypothetical protein